MGFRLSAFATLLLFTSPGWAQPDAPEPPADPAAPTEPAPPPSTSDSKPGDTPPTTPPPATPPAEPTQPPPEPSAPPAEPTQPAAPTPPAESPPPRPPAQPEPPPVATAPYEGDPLYAPLEPEAPPPLEEPEGSDEGGGFEIPPWSARIDPFNWLLEGRLGLELEFGLLDFMTVELVPTFVVQEKPPTLNLSGAPDVLRQESNGVGPISGAALDVGLWLDGTAFHGYVIRLGLATYGYRYATADDAGEIDSVKVTQREAFAMFGTQANWGAFTLAGGIGLGVELNKQQRCFTQNATSVAQVQTDDCDDELQIATDRTTIEPVNLNGNLFPVSIIGRFSLGVLFE